MNGLHISLYRIGEHGKYFFNNSCFVTLPLKGCRILTHDCIVYWNILEALFYGILRHWWINCLIEILLKQWKWIDVGWRRILNLENPSSPWIIIIWFYFFSFLQKTIWLWCIGWVPNKPFWGILSFIFVGNLLRGCIFFYIFVGILLRFYFITRSSVIVWRL